MTYKNEAVKSGSSTDANVWYSHRRPWGTPDRHAIASGGPESGLRVPRKVSSTALEPPLAGALGEGAYDFSRTLGDRFAVPHRDDLQMVLRNKVCHASQRILVLHRVEGKGRPARAKDRVGSDGVASEQDLALLTVEGEVPRRVAGRVNHLHGADLFPALQGPINGAGRVLASPQRCPELKVVDPPVSLQRAHRPYRDRLCGAFTGDDVHFPLVGVDGRAALDLEESQPAEVGAVAVRQQDILEVRHLLVDSPYSIE